MSFKLWIILAHAPRHRLQAHAARQFDQAFPQLREHDLVLARPQVALARLDHLVPSFLCRPSSARDWILNVSPALAADGLAHVRPVDVDGHVLGLGDDERVEAALDVRVRLLEAHVPPVAQRCTEADAKRIKEQKLKEEKTSVASAPEESELDSYSKGVQNRIKKLTEKYRQEERDKAEAVRVSTQLLEENKKLKSRVQALDTGYLSEYGTRIESQTDAAKRAYKEAYEAGDTDRMLEAQQALSNIAIETQRYNTAK